VRVRVPAGASYFFFRASRPALGPTQEVLEVFPSRGMELTIHLHAAPGLRMGGSINLLPSSRGQAELCNTLTLMFF